MPICLCKGFFGIIYMKVNKILQLHHEQNMGKCRTIIPILWSEDQKRLMESSLSMDKTYTFNLLIIHCETHNVTEKKSVPLNYFARYCIFKSVSCTTKYNAFIFMITIFLKQVLYIVLCLTWVDISLHLRRKLGICLYEIGEHNSSYYQLVFQPSS